MRPLRTDRLDIRPWAVDDADFVLDMYSRWEVQRFIGREPRVMTDHHEALAAISRWQSWHHGVLGASVVVDRATSAPLGNVVLKPIPASSDTEPLPDSGDIEIGWHLHPDAWGHGYAAEAAAAVLAYAFDEGGLPQVIAVTHPDNLASQRVALRIGMTHRGRTDRYYNRDSELFVRAAANHVAT